MLGVYGLSYAPAGREARMNAAAIERETLAECRLMGLLSADEAEKELRERKLWTDFDADQMKKLQKAAEDMKVGLYENRREPKKVGAIREALAMGLSELRRLESTLHSFDHATDVGVARAAGARYLAGCSLRKKGGAPYWEDPESDWERPDAILDEAIEAYLSQRLGEADYRELARTEPWRSIWGCRKGAGGDLFGVPAADWTDEQRVLSFWSTLYESIRESPDAPDDEWFSDDAMIDGWLILRARASEKDKVRRMGEEIAARHANADEIYVMNEVMDPSKVDLMNDGVAKMIKEKRMQRLKAQGTMTVLEEPDTEERLIAAISGGPK